MSRLLLYWDIEIPVYDLVAWQDGLYWALVELAKKHEVFINLKSNEPSTFIRDGIHFRACAPQTPLLAQLLVVEPTHVLLWGQLYQPSMEILKQRDYKVGLCFAGGAEQDHRANEYDVIFTENKFINDKFIEQGYNAEVAFGINTDIFKPYPQPKLFKALYPAVFGMWKRQNLFAEAFGREGVCIGRYQPHEPQCLQWAQDAGCLTVPIILPQSAMPYFYNASQCVVSTATNDSGGQRTVLEAMACNVPIIVCNDNYKASEYIRESGWGRTVDPNPDVLRDALESIPRACDSREYILNNWTHRHYAKEIEKWLVS